jgi:hypothetical protein
MNPEFKINIKNKKSTYSLGKYKVIFYENSPETNTQARNFCSIELISRREVLWSLYFFHKDNHASLGDLNDHTKQEGTLKAVIELDLLWHCLEDYFQKKGIKTVSGRTNTKFGRFLKKIRGWKNKPVNKHCTDIEKIVTKKNNKPIGAYRTIIRKGGKK